MFALCAGASAALPSYASTGTVSPRQSGCRPWPASYSMPTPDLALQRGAVPYQCLRHLRVAGVTRIDHGGAHATQRVAHGLRVVGRVRQRRAGIGRAWAWAKTLMAPMAKAPISGRSHGARGSCGDGSWFAPGGHRAWPILTACIASDSMHAGAHALGMEAGAGLWSDFCAPSRIHRRKPVLSDVQLRQIMPNLAATRLLLYLSALNLAMQSYEVNTVLRTAAFVAQLAHESGEFRWMEEIWGPTEAQRRYEAPNTLAAKLGTTEAGDGQRFKGRGPIQIAGRFNDAKYGGLLGIDLVADPALAATPEVAFSTAGLYWQTNDLNASGRRGAVRHHHAAHQRRHEWPARPAEVLRNGRGGAGRRLQCRGHDARRTQGCVARRTLVARLRADPERRDGGQTGGCKEGACQKGACKAGRGWKVACKNARRQEGRATLTFMRRRRRSAPP